MSLGDGADVDPVEEFPLLAQVLHAAADRGEGTVLGLAPPGRSRIGRVSRVDPAVFADRLAAAYRERSPAMVRYATRKVGDPDRADEAPSAPVDVSTQVADAALLRDALAALPPREREAVVIRMQWQLSVAEAAEVMQLSAGAVKRYTSDGLRRLRERLDPAFVA